MTVSCKVTATYRVWIRNKYSTPTFSFQLRFGSDLTGSLPHKRTARTNNDLPAQVALWLRPCTRELAAGAESGDRLGNSPMPAF
jgi:hypothetical protein